ncbi:hypothetical protein SAMN05421736_102215 [Evansella caseinilytica]|uniref:Uncharacterized protein n=1 Tax=Evansella caseinilytica TaxID=1503961 RepID=A0A1H3KQR5_9BACI|nr:hypothetical protein [Evansella caseinilytica]SDY54005.1 hypothetical protein SAMN05421736_102215 [Evansella caseinilytica]
MSVFPHVTAEYKKEYMFKGKDGFALTLNPEKFHHFCEGENGDISWKWIHLPMKAEGKQLNKLLLANNSEKSVNIDVLVRYEIFSDHNIPLVYFSPTREAIVLYDGSEYRIFGGISSHGNGDRFSTIPVNVEQWKKSSAFHFQPLSKQSKGWSLEFQLHLKQGAASYLYEWEFKGGELQEIEEMHTQYQRLLGNGELIY